LRASIPLSTWTVLVGETTVGDKESRAYKKLLPKGRTAYGRDRAKDADANGGTFSTSITKLYAGYYDAMRRRCPVRKNRAASSGV
jgi:hypothetical protein